MAKCPNYRTRTINLKSILEELESSFKFNLIFNSASGNALDIMQDNDEDFEILRSKIYFLAELGFISSEEYEAIRTYFFNMKVSFDKEADKKSHIK